MPKIKNIFFDFGRVIGLFDHMKTYERLAVFSALSAEEIHNLIFKNSRIENNFDEGKLSFSQFHEKVTTLIGADKNKLVPEIFFDIWGDIFTENPEITRLLGRLNPEVRIFILSNSNSVHWNYIKKLPVIKKFFFDEDHWILSFQVGKKKPSEKIFKEAIRKGGNNPEEALYIDDVGEYIAAAKAFGINGIQYDCRTDLIKKLQRELENYEVFKK